jgi:hypothetical protein
VKAAAGLITALSVIAFASVVLIEFSGNQFRMKLLWILVLLGSVVGGFILIGGFTSANSAPQEAAAAGLALACAVIPYCLVRSIQELARDTFERDELRTQTRLLASLANSGGENRTVGPVEVANDSNDISSVVCPNCKAANPLGQDLCSHCMGDLRRATRGDS